jgi:hypothetical protein
MVGLPNHCDISIVFEVSMFEIPKFNCSVNTDLVIVGDIINELQGAMAPLFGTILYDTLFFPQKYNYTSER